MPIECQSNLMPIRHRSGAIKCQPIPIWLQSDANLTPIRWQSNASVERQSSANHASSHSNLIKCLFIANLMSILCPSIANSFSCHVMPIHHRSANPMSILYQSIDPSLQQIDKYDTDQLSISCFNHQKMDRHRFGTHWHKSRQSYTNQRPVP